MTGIPFTDRIATWFEQQAFGVCTWWGKKLGIRPTRIRMYFIYLSFFTVGSPVILYFIMAFFLEHKEFFPFRRKRRSSVWDL
ncbi:MAG: PspC domain-containing protein [Bacteroidota bacterium]|jgi:phage shock protein C